MLYHSLKGSLSFPKLKLHKEINQDIAEHRKRGKKFSLCDGSIPYNVYKLDWWPRYHECKIPEPYDSKAINLLFAPSAEYLKEIRRMSTQALLEWSTPCGFDTMAREHRLSPAIEYVRTAFWLLCDCLYDEHTHYFYRGDDKWIMRYVLGYKFWYGQTGSGLVGEHAGFETLYNRQYQHKKGRLRPNPTWEKAVKLEGEFLKVIEAFEKKEDEIHAMKYACCAKSEEGNNMALLTHMAQKEFGLDVETTWYMAPRKEYNMPFTGEEIDAASLERLIGKLKGAGFKVTKMPEKRMSKNGDRTMKVKKLPPAPATIPKGTTPAATDPAVKKRAVTKRVCIWRNCKKQFESDAPVRGTICPHCHRHQNKDTGTKKTAKKTKKSK